MHHGLHEQESTLGNGMHICWKICQIQDLKSEPELRIDLYLAVLKRPLIIEMQHTRQHEACKNNNVNVSENRDVLDAKCKQALLWNVWKLFSRMDNAHCETMALASWLACCDIEYVHMMQQRQCWL